MLKRFMFFLFGHNSPKATIGCKTRTPYKEIIDSLTSEVENFHLPPLKYWQKKHETERNKLINKISNKYSSERVNELYNKYSGIVNDKVLFRDKGLFDSGLPKTHHAKISNLVDGIENFYILLEDPYWKNFFRDEFRAQTYLEVKLNSHYTKLTYNHFMSMLQTIGFYAEHLNIDEINFNRTGLNSYNFPRIRWLNENKGATFSTRYSNLDTQLKVMRNEFATARTKGTNPYEVFEYVYMTSTYRYEFTALPKSLSYCLVVELLLYLDMFFVYIHNNQHAQEVMKSTLDKDAIYKADIINLFFDQPSKINNAIEFDYIKILISNLYYLRMPIGGSTMFFEDGNFSKYYSTLHYFKYGDLIKTISVSLGGNPNNGMFRSASLNHIKVASGNPNGYYTKISDPNLDLIHEYNI